MRVKLSSVEAEKLCFLARFASDNDRQVSHLGIFADGGRTSWIASDNLALAVLDAGECDMTEATAAVPKRDFILAAELCNARDLGGFEIVFGSQGNGLIRMSGVNIPFESRPEGIIGIVGAAQKLPSPNQKIVLRSLDLSAAIRLASTRPAYLGDDSFRRFEFRIDAGAGLLRTVSEWTDHADTGAVVQCEAQQDASFSTNPLRVLDFLNLIDDQNVSIEYGDGPGIPIWLRTELGPSMLIMPALSYLEALRPNFNAVLAKLLGRPVNELIRDEDGDYPIALRHGRTAFIRLEGREVSRRVPSRVVLFTPVAEDIEPTLDALTEINEQNSVRRFARLYILKRRLFLETEISLEDITVSQLSGAIEVFSDTAEELGPWMQGFFGDPAHDGTGKEDGDH